VPGLGHRVLGSTLGLRRPRLIWPRSATLQWWYSVRCRRIVNEGPCRLSEWFNASVWKSRLTSPGRKLYVHMS
jgi:hypothetical protein